MPVALRDRDGRLCLVDVGEDGFVLERLDLPEGTARAEARFGPKEVHRAIARSEDAPSRGHVWTFAGRTYDLRRRVLVMGVVNCTPDSFYERSRAPSTEEAVSVGRAMVDEGADLLDIGGESTRPGATPVPEDEEVRRVIPVIEKLACCGVPLSVDTRHPGVARAALEAGASIVNDVAGFRDPRMREVLPSSAAGAVVMHMRGDPSTMQQDPRYEWVTGEVVAFLASALDRLAEVGVPDVRVVVDPGIGFGKTLAHNLELLRDLSTLSCLGRPILVGLSRKSFIGALLGLPPQERLEGSLAAASVAIMHGARLVRVHDVQATVRAVRVLEALL